MADINPPGNMIGVTKVLIDNKEKLSTATIALHWIIGPTVIAQLVIGFYMAWTGDFDLRDLHKSVGVTLLVFVFLRVALRIRNGWPQPVGTYKKIEIFLAKAVHWILIIGTLVLPVSGLISTWAGGNDVPLFGWELLAENHDDAGNRMRRYKAVQDFFRPIHSSAGYVLAGAVLLHIAGALKHHFFDRDGTFRRMLGATIK